MNANLSREGAHLVALIDEFDAGAGDLGAIAEAIIEVVLRGFAGTEIEEQLLGPLASFEPGASENVEDFYTAEEIRSLLRWARSQVWLSRRK